MIDLYYWNTSNGRKITIMLEECGLPYKVHAINIGKGDQFTPAFVTINPEQQDPGDRRFEGPAASRRSSNRAPILIYLAEKTGKFLPQRAAPALRDAAMADVPDGRRRADVRPGPSFPPRGRAGALRDRALSQGDPAPLRRDGRAPRQGTRTSPATTPSPTSPPIPGSRATSGRLDLADFPNVRRWYDAISARPAVARGMAVPPRGPSLKADRL